MGNPHLKDIIHYLTSRSLPDKGIKPEEYAENHFNVKRMIELNWTIGEMPKNPTGAQCFKLNKDGEIELGIYNKLEQIDTL